MRALVSWKMPRRSLRACIPKATNVVDEGASIACDVTAVVIGSCPLGGGLGRRVSGAEWIAGILRVDLVQNQETHRLPEVGKIAHYDQNEWSAQA